MSKTKKLVALGVTAAIVAGGSAGAIAATNTKEDPRQTEREMLSDAAQRLGVSAKELRSALSAARDEQIDEAVEEGRLTEEQAAEIKRRSADGPVLGFGPPPGGGFHMRFDGPGMGPGGDIAEALGIGEAQLQKQLRAGKSLADIAEGQGKSLDDVKAALKQSARERLDEAVKDGRITEEQRDEMLEHVDEHVDRLAEGLPPRMERGAMPPPGRFGGP